MAGPSSAPEISVVIPAHNEAGNVDGLFAKLGAVLPNLARRWEILYVDDGSTDGTAEEVRRWFGRMQGLRLFRHPERSGQSAALWTGFRRASGGIVVTMDGDGQNDPEDIQRLLEALEGCDLACGVRVNRRDSRWKRLTSWVANRYRALMLGDPFRDSGCTFRAFHRKVLEALPPFQGVHRFLPSICAMHGFRVAEVPVKHLPRERGRSKYGVRDRLWIGIRDTFAMRWYRARRLPEVPVEEVMGADNESEARSRR